MSKKSGRNSQEVRKFVKTVLAFYKKQGRTHLPWRKTRDPYAILVSEIMLQQTQVDRVVPYFILFLDRFPSVGVLAQSQLGLVLKEWQGLGYNRRAKMLHMCAQEIVERHRGVVPTSRSELEELSGIGPYTAGAVRAFAHDEREVFIETNIRSVFIHHFFPRSRSVSDSRLLPLITECVQQVQHPREWYAALMDYGAYLKRVTVNPSRKSKHHAKQPRFEGSLRQMRGEILRALSNKTALTYLKSDARFEKALEALVKEGFVVKRREEWVLA